ncbi:MAG: heme biosynthesis HemY N-terminal domain-containing protein [Rhodanobacteraceae bacterium]
MRIWIAILLLLAVAVAAAFGWHWLAADPGYVLVRLRGVSIETSVAFALVCLLVVWALLSLLWRLARWPSNALRRAAHSRGRDRLAAGVTAFAEGRYAQAETDLAKAARHEPVRAPALLAQAYAARARGASARADEILIAAAEHASPAALASRAQFFIDDGQSAQALELLKPAAASGTLAPRGWRMLIEAALISGDNEAAVGALAPLARSQMLGPDAQHALEARVFSAALAGAADVDALEARWSSLSRSQRRQPRLVQAYALRASALGRSSEAMAAIEAVQRRDFNDDLARVYARLGPGQLAERTRKAEGWLERAPNSAPLLVALGRMCRDQSLWISAEKYLRRALGVDESAAAWELLGDCRHGQGEDAAASVCYANALRATRDEATTPVPDQREDAALDTHALVFEERDAHGVPRLSE